MSQSRSKIVRRLTLAQQDQVPVTVRRKYLDDDETFGFVIAVSDKWVVLQDLVQKVRLDAVVLLRLDHVSKVESPWNQGYVTRVVAGLGEPIQEFECAPDVTISDLLRIINERAEFIMIYLETRKDYCLALGKVRRIGNKRLDLHYIRADGTWVDFIDAWKLKDVTRVEFGGLYIQALERFGDPMPEVLSRKKR